MKKISRKRAAVIAALSVTVIILGIIAFVPQEREHTFAEIQPPAAPGIVHIELMNTPITSSVTISVPAQTPEAMPTPAPTATPASEKRTKIFYTRYSERYHLRRIRRGGSNAYKDAGLATLVRSSRPGWHVFGLWSPQPEPSQSAGKCGAG